MTVENQFPYQSFTANGSQTNFALGFYVDDKNHFEVKKNDQAVSKNDYSYNPGSNSIVFNTTPKSGDVIEVKRDTATERATTYATYNNTFRPETLNKDIDRVWLKLQELGVVDWILDNKIDSLRAYTDYQDQQLKTDINNLKSYSDAQDQLLKTDISNLKAYSDQRDQEIQNSISNLRNYADNKDQQLQANIDGLKQYSDVQDEYVKQYLLAKIREQGVAIDQLNSYYEYIFRRIAEIATEKGWDASLVVDGSKTQHQLNNEFKNAKTTIVTPLDFNAPNNGVDDDLPAVRAAIAYLESIGGGTLNMKSNVRWKFNSVTGTKDNMSYMIILSKESIHIDFGSQGSGVDVGIEVDTVFYLEPTARFLTVKGGLLQGKNKAKYFFYSNKSGYNPYLKFSDIHFRGFIESAFSLNTFVSSFNKLVSSYAKKGFKFNNKDGVAEITSVVMLSCYALECSDAGFEVTNRFMYSNLISCAVDACKTAYRIDGQGTNLISCGAERCEVFYESQVVQEGVEIKSPCMVQIGSTNPDTPVEEIFKVGGNGTITISHPTILGNGTPVYRNYILGAYRRIDGNLKIIIKGRGINKSNTKIVGTTVYVQPIIFDDANPFITDYTQSVSHENLKQFFEKQEHQDLKATMTITLTGEDINPVLRTLKNVGGVGKIIIQGSSSDNTITELSAGTGNFLQFANVSCPLIFRNLTIKTNDNINNYETTMMTFDNCQNVYFDNVRFLTRGACGNAFRATKTTNVTIGSTCTVEGNFNAAKTFERNSGSVVRIEPRDVPPTAIRWYLGDFIPNSSPSIGTYKNIAGWRLTLGMNTGYYVWLAVRDERRYSFNLSSITIESLKQHQQTISAVLNSDIGDFVNATYSTDLNGVLLQAQVISSSSIKVTFTNLNAEAVTIPSGTVYLKIN